MGTENHFIIETGIAYRISIIYLYASFFELIVANRRVVGIDIRKHIPHLIEQYAMFKRIAILEESAIDSEIAERLGEIARVYKK